MSGPVFVTGPDRSGTTLMYALLASHPEMAMVRRTNLWRWFHGRFGDLGDPANLDRCLEAMVRYERLSVLGIDPERVRRELAGAEVTYGRLFRLVHEHHAQRLGRARWGDKSLHTEHHAAAVFGELPDATVVHLLRDPRDRHASVARRYHDRARSRAGVTARWIASTRAGERNYRRWPGRYLMVRFEDLALHPERTLRLVCDTVGLAYDPVMLTMAGADDTPGDDGGNSSFERIAPGTISTRPVGRYRSVLGPQDVAAIQAVAGRLMARHGYVLEPPPPSRTERARLVARVVLPEAARVAASLAAKPLYRRRAEVPPGRLRAELVP
jgi:hypothetical protein